jgi:hypothetical protein
MKMTKGGPLHLLQKEDKPLLMLRKDSVKTGTPNPLKSPSGKIIPSNSSPRSKTNTNNTAEAGLVQSNSNGALSVELGQGEGAVAGLGMEFGTIYEGQWAEDREHGRGTKYWADGKVYHGAWVDGTQTGDGVCKYANGAYYYGNWDTNFVCLFTFFIILFTDFSRYLI